MTFSVQSQCSLTWEHSSFCLGLGLSWHVEGFSSGSSTDILELHTGINSPERGEWRRVRWSMEKPLCCHILCSSQSRNHDLVAQKMWILMLETFDNLISPLNVPKGTLMCTQVGTASPLSASPGLYSFSCAHARICQNQWEKFSRWLCPSPTAEDAVSPKAQTSCASVFFSLDRFMLESVTLYLLKLSLKKEEDGLYLGLTASLILQGCSLKYLILNNKEGKEIYLRFGGFSWDHPCGMLLEIKTSRHHLTKQGHVWFWRGNHKQHMVSCGWNNASRDNTTHRSKKYCMSNSSAVSEQHVLWKTVQRLEKWS